MSEPNDPMHPQLINGNDQPGMTIRQAFVMAAMQGYLAGGFGGLDNEVISEYACSAADACLRAERESRE